jgi:hypothetical protein
MRKRYESRYRAPWSSFNDAAPFDELLYDPIYQLMRLRLLADRMVRSREFAVTQATVVVVCPEGNRAYRERITSRGLAARLPEGSTLESAIKSLLKCPEGFVMTSPERLMDGLRRARLGSAITPWLAYHNERYGW